MPISAEVRLRKLLADGIVVGLNPATIVHGTYDKNLKSALHRIAGELMDCGYICEATQRDLLAELLVGAFLAQLSWESLQGEELLDKVMECLRNAAAFSTSYTHSNWGEVALRAAIGATVLTVAPHLEVTAAFELAREFVMGDSR